MEYNKTVKDWLKQSKNDYNKNVKEWMASLNKQTASKTSKKSAPKTIRKK